MGRRGSRGLTRRWRGKVRNQGGVDRVTLGITCPSIIHNGSRDRQKNTKSAMKVQSPSLEHSARTLPLPKNGSKVVQTAPKLNNDTKHVANGFSGLRPRSSTDSFLRHTQRFLRPGPGSGSGSRTTSPSQKKTPAGRSHSSDGLGSVSAVRLTEKDRISSRSLTQVQKQPSPVFTVTALPCSIQAPPKGGKKSPVTRQVSGGGLKATGRSGLPPSALKKPLSPALGPASKPSGISYKLSRPMLLKQARPLRVMSATASELNSVKISSPTENSRETPAESPEKDVLSSEPVSIVGETLEDMSLSSTSSLDRNDTSQEYMDDFDNLGVEILLFSPKNDEDDSGLDQSCARFDDDKTSVNGVTEASGLCFLEDGVDWAGLKLKSDDTQRHVSLLSHQRKMSQTDYHEQGGSSLDLSPSDSCGSAGTYMWDEEDLEPLGGANSASINCNSQHIEDFDSEDILKDLDTCDLEDDDLMLDTDFTEDASVLSDRDGMSHMAEWRRRQLCWGTNDVQNEDGDFTCYKLTEDPGNKRTDICRDGDIILDLCPSRSFITRSSSGTLLSSFIAPPAVLGVDVEELADDCSAVRSQLEFLQMLLLQEEEVDDNTLTMDSPEVNDSSQSSDTLVKALQQEVLQLREQLRSRDRTIAQLTLQLTVPSVTAGCGCQETTGKMDRHTQTGLMERDRVKTQAVRREQSQILHSTSQDHQDLLTTHISSITQHHAPPIHQTTPPEQPSDLFTTRPTLKTALPAAHPAGPPDQVLLTVQAPLPNQDLLKAETPAAHPAHTLQSSAAAPPPKTMSSRQPLMPHNPENNIRSGLRPRTRAVTSRLPKPKSH
uniref:Serine-rich coiled-coil domain-containing protein 2-like n=1 Tax=Cynoglossus semilaevis TaxID=244447 RepID=A0A3P8UIH4_CYNSE